ncbi:hypothetical protein NE237_023306 [Protea cynaroides]|uniref:Uncharacterized protein n=1 Tax=Protea cynaroides TaxID=273540 RepID=A0A9Q0HBH6_9MAGN|nr:hypothetical protein NE237_023306 [Protea cynaroides]
MGQSQPGVSIQWQRMELSMDIFIGALALTPLCAHAIVAQTNFMENLKMHLKCLSDILVGNSGIQKLQLNSTGLSDEGAKAISEMLKKNSSLCVIELDDNMIDYSGFSSLVESLLENNTIRTIHLNGNYGGALGAAALAKGIEGNKSLRVQIYLICSTLLILLHIDENYTDNKCSGMLGYLGLMKSLLGCSHALELAAGHCYLPKPDGLCSKSNTTMKWQ